MDPRRLAYLRRMGIEVWRRREAAPGPAAPVQAPAARPPAATPEPGGAAAAGPGERARRIAAMDWPALRQAVATCTACPLHAGRTQGVFGTGDERADWMVIGEAPGADEDRLGEPFVGRAGRLLDAVLLAVGLDRSTVYIANIIKSRPPRNRDPLPEEVASCLPYLHRQIELVSPRIILAVGRVAAQTLLGSGETIGRLRGRVHAWAGVPLIVTYHPAYLLRSPREKAKVWADLKLARRTLDRRPQAR